MNQPEYFPVIADPERVAQLIAHRACIGVEHDPANGKLHGYCVVCGVPWPCDYAGRPPTPSPTEGASSLADARPELGEKQTAAALGSGQARLSVMLYRSLERLSLAIEACGRIGFTESKPTTNAHHGSIWMDLNDAQKDAKLKLKHYQKVLRGTASDRADELSPEKSNPKQPEERTCATEIALGSGQELRERLFTGNELEAIHDRVNTEKREHEFYWTTMARLLNDRTGFVAALALPLAPKVPHIDPQGGQHES